LLAVTAAGVPVVARADDFVIHTFERRQLTDVYYSEGIAAGDLNRDGHVDIVYGPYWFAGPTFQEKREIYPAKPQPTEKYADHFFAWIYDLNGDGWNDIVTAGFPGTPAYAYQNPGIGGLDRSWPRHQVFDKVSNESPHFTNLVGDDRPEMVCTREGFFGYATFQPGHAFEAWTFHPISARVAPAPFGHGLGVGDVNGDGRMDVLMKDGWFEQPRTPAGDGPWTFHPVRFTSSGGADMHAYDVDGDGDNDVITSLTAHDFGLAWFEQLAPDGTGGSNEPSFRAHTIMGDRPAQNRYGLGFSELHSVKLADIDGDGLKDIVTGKTYYSHHTQSPMWDAGAVVYWFRLVRTQGGVDWVPYKADGDSGIGRQLVVHDINGDGLPDLAAGGMKGANVLLHRREAVTAERWRAAQPRVYDVPEPPPVQGPQGAIDQKTGRVPGAIEGEELTVVHATAGKVGRQKMAGFKTGRWSGGEQLFWSGARPGDRLALEIDVSRADAYQVTVALTAARDFGIVQVGLDDQPLGEPLDLYHYPEVAATGELNLGARRLGAGKHRLTFELKGANPSAVRAFLVGLDYVRLEAR
jgi:hypothetical protein